MQTKEVVGAIILNKDKFLIIQRAETRPQPLTWGLPSGKIEKDEDRVHAIKREIFEETGNNIDLNQLQYKYSKEYDFSKDGYNINYHVFLYNTNDSFEVSLSNEHISYKWITPKRCLDMKNLIDGLDDVIKRIFN